MPDPTTPTPSLSPAPAGNLAELAASNVPTASAAPPVSQASPTTSPPTTPEKPSWVPDAAWTDKGFNFEAFKAHYEKDIEPALAQFNVDNVRRQTLPKTPDEVVVSVPKDWKPPEGVQDFKLNPADPAFSKFKEFAVTAGLDNDQVSKLAGIYADLASAPEAAYRSGLRAEMAKLGVNGPQRVTAVIDFMKSQIGPDATTPMSAMLVTAASIQAMEKLINKMSSQGTARFTSVRDPAGGDRGSVSEADYAKMSVSDRMAYAKGFDQKPFLAQKRA